MGGVYGIGTVARLAQVSVRTLRHYDEIGLLLPAWVDPQTGYRWYTPEQLHRLHRILVLRDLGVSLTEIGTLLDAEVTIEQLRGILLLREAEARERMEAETQRLARVEARLRHIEEETMAEYEIAVKRVAPVRVMALAEDVARIEDIGPTEQRLFPRLEAAASSADVQRAPGPSIADIDFTGGGIRVTVGIPVADATVIDRDGITDMILSGLERAATTVVSGEPDYDEAFTALVQWADETGETRLGHSREVYLSCEGPSTPGSSNSRSPRRWPRDVERRDFERRLVLVAVSRTTRD
jgi:DNA-binding transcriptional MerR regulator